MVVLLLVRDYFVGGNTRLESDTNATASNLVAALQVDGGVAIGKKLYWWRY